MRLDATFHISPVLLESTTVLLFNFQNQTRGLFGNWSHDVLDDFTLPNGMMAGVGTTMNNFESLHKDFAMHCKYINFIVNLIIIFLASIESNGP